jgi:hypothetical protein
MYRLLSGLSAGELLTRQAPILVAAMIIAELFYKFHSFTLECGAFLATWFLIDAAADRLVRRGPREDR